MVPRQEASTAPLRILLVEDHDGAAKLLAMLLSADGHCVETAGDIATALAVAERQEFDLLVSDLGLPDGSGHDLMKQLRQRGHTLPGIALSGFGHDAEVQRSHESGFAIHLTKPASRQAIAAAVASLAVARPHPQNPPRSDVVPPLFDPQVALARCLGKAELLAQMVEIFFEDVAQRLPKLQQALELGDVAEVGATAHRIKGTIAYLAAEPARQAATLVERVALNGCPPADLEDPVRALLQECNTLAAALSEWKAAAAK